MLFTVPKNSNIGGLNIGSQSFNKFIISKIPALANKGGDLFAELLRFGVIKIGDSWYMIHIDQTRDRRWQ